MEIINYIEIGKRIKESRLAKELTQQKIAEELGVSDEYVSKIETGKAKISLTRLAQLSILLDTPIEKLITGVVSKSTDYKISEVTKVFEELSAQEKDFIIAMIEQVKLLRRHK